MFKRRISEELIEIICKKWISAELFLNCFVKQLGCWTQGCESLAQLIWGLKQDNTIEVICTFTRTTVHCCLEFHMLQIQVLVPPLSIVCNLFTISTFHRVFMCNSGTLKYIAKFRNLHHVWSFELHTTYI